MATYVNNLRLKEIATGAESGTWGTSTNTNLELIADAFGSGTEAITTNADTHTTTIADGSADEGRAIYMKYTGTLDSACTITLAPETINKFWIVENATSGSQNIIISQGSGANITIGNGKVAAIFTDGAGGGAAVLDAFADLELSSTLTVAGASTLTGAVTMSADASVGDDLTLGSDAAVLNFGADSDVSLTHVADTGLLLNSTRQLQFNDSSQYISGASATKMVIAATDEVEINATAVDLNGTLDVSGTSTLTGNVTMSADASVGDDLTLVSDAAVLNFGADSDVSLTHVADTGLLLNSTRQLQFNDASQYISGTSATVLSIAATDEIDLTATAIDLNGTLDVSGTLAVTGASTLTGLLSVDDTTESTSTTTGSIHTDGGLGVVKDSFFGGAMKLAGTNSFLTIEPTNATGALLTITANTAGSGLIDLKGVRGAAAGSDIGRIRSYWDGNNVAEIAFNTGTDTGNKDDGTILFMTSPSGSSPVTAVTIGADKTLTAAGALAVTSTSTLTGNVGIGGSPTSAGLAVTGSATFNGAINAEDNIELNGSLTLAEYIYHKADTDTYMRFQPDAWTVRTAGTDAISVDSSQAASFTGNVGIGMSAGTQALSVLETSATHILDLENSNASNPDGVTIDLSAAAPNNRTRFFLQNEDSAAIKSTLWSDGGANFTGDVGIGDTSAPGADLDIHNYQNADTGIIIDNQLSSGSRSSAGAHVTLACEQGGYDPRINFVMGGGGFDWAIGVDNSDSDKFVIAGGTDAGPALETDPRLTIDSTGATFSGTLAVTGTSAFTGDVAFGGGLFIGDGGAFTAANELDDYEEGTWTPGIKDIGGNTATLSTATGTYTKIGRQVILNYIVQLSSVGSMTGGYVQMTGLPFDHPNNDYNGTGMVDFFTNLDTNVSSLAWDTSSTVGLVWLTGVVAAGAGASIYVPPSYFGGNEKMKGSVIYYV